MFQSKRGLYYITLVVSLVEDLMEDGVVSASDIVILTPYQGQYIHYIYYLAALNMLKDVHPNWDVRDVFVRTIDVFGCDLELRRQPCSEDKGSYDNQRRGTRDCEGEQILWFLSGTPFEVSPSDIAGYMSCLEIPSWKMIKSSAIVLYNTSAQDSELGKQFTSLCSKKDTRPEILQIIERQFTAALQEVVICYVAKTLRFGQSLLELLPHKQRTIYYHIPKVVSRCNAGTGAAI